MEVVVIHPMLHPVVILIQVMIISIPQTHVLQHLITANVVILDHRNTERSHADIDEAHEDNLTVIEVIEDIH